VSNQLTWLGQAGFRLDISGLHVLIDPFLSEHEARLYPPPDAVPISSGVDWLLVTHEHLDHFDEEFVVTLAARSPHATLVLPRPLADAAAQLSSGLHVIGVQPGDSIEMAPGVRLQVLPAWHAIEVGDGYSTGSGDSGLARFVGYIIRTPELSIYHSGDTLVTAELREELARDQVDIALLPVNGRDYYREAQGLVGNMDAREAVQLAQEIGVSLLIPTHWDLWRGNTINPGIVADEAVPGAKVHVLTLARSVPMPLPTFGSRAAHSETPG
jgi:L-ascorbate metabolism protein UlaG (beta-lactamase superfamily)